MSNLRSEQSVSSQTAADATAPIPNTRVVLASDSETSSIHFVDTPKTAEPLSETEYSGEDGRLISTLVRASAGTGKTYRLAARLLRILLQGSPPESILATTFTRKAAGEILNRVLRSLADAADEKNDAALAALATQVGLPHLHRSVCLQLLEKLIRNIHRLRICTLDSLFAQLARSFPFELDLPPAWRLTDEIEEMWLRERAVDSVIAALAPTEMTAVLSMLGKGDTRRSVARELLQVVAAAYSIQRGCGPEVWNRLGTPKPPPESDLTRAAGLLRQAQPTQKRLQTKLDAVASMIEQRDFKPLFGDTLLINIAKARRTRSELKYYNSKFPEGLDEAFDILYAAVRSTLLGLTHGQNEATATVLAAYDHHVGQLKQNSRTLGFDDVAVRLATRFASLDQRVLSSRMDGAIDHMLLDEFQDTSPIQWQVLRPLAARVTASGPDVDPDVAEPLAVDRSFFCVGDTKQAIYGWRGGVAEIFDAVADQLPGVVEEEQHISRRSSQVIIDVVNRTFQNLHRHPFATNATGSDPANKNMHEALAIDRFVKRFPKHTTAKTDLPGFFRFETSRKSEDAENELSQGLCFEDAAKLAKKIHDDASDKSIGILTRTNRGVAQLIFLLERLGVEVSQEGGNPLTDSAAVEVVLSALMMAEHPGDGRWEFHVSATALANITDFGPAMVRSMTEERGIAETIEFLAGALAPDCDARETLRLKQLAHLAINYQTAAAPRLRDFVRLVREKRIERPQAAAVRVMTVHQAKGLEFDAVILPELDGELTRSTSQCVADRPALGEQPRAMTRYVANKSWHFLPKQWQAAFGAQAAGNMTESLCLLYVAMTRAKQALHVVIQPPGKSSFENRTAAALLYHALGCELDPTASGATLDQHGDSNWHRGNGAS